MDALGSTDDGMLGSTAEDVPGAGVSGAEIAPSDTAPGVVHPGVVQAGAGVTYTGRSDVRRWPQPRVVNTIAMATRAAAGRLGRGTNEVSLCMTIFHLLEIRAGMS
jgi:hypothetical protein